MAELWVVVVFGGLGTLVSAGLWMDCWLTHRLAARAVEDPEHESLVAVARSALYHETVRLAILLIFVGSGWLSLLVPGTYRSAIVWALAIIPVLVASSSLYAARERHRIRQRLVDDSEEAAEAS